MTEKYGLLKVICLLLITAKLFVGYDITWFETFIPIYVAFGMEALKMLTEQLEVYLEKMKETLEKKGKHDNN